MGLEVAIDDFGTGYSSLTHLRLLPVRELKIDRSFIVDMLGHENDVLIVRSIIDLAHALGLRVTAEGVENAPSLERLTEFGCDRAQGFHMARPMPMEDLRLWLRESPWKPESRRAAKARIR
jgi:EAL domain-containing protein (putative c-di-GMP-specific phosphodiesterase class I)